MDFIVFVLFMGFGFLLGEKLLRWALPVVFKTPVENQCTGVHTWGYNDRGILHCSVCKKVALDD